ncbi:MAG: winged helix-turn-helix domain-containing protein, partial [Bryobacterales bacterium]|nr:winged helix-turn-helix domain-containing protein [Bryobacterales bacterium]
MQGDSAESRVVCFGLFEADLIAGELRRRGVKVKLQEQPFQVLVMLLERPGDVVTREELRRRLWPTEDFGDFEHGVNRAVHRLREALDDSAETPRFIETLPKRGYRFIAPVEKGSRAPVENRRHVHRLSRKRAGIAGAMAAVALLLSLNAGRLRDRFLPGARPAGIRSLAVMPFSNLSRDADQEYFADGVTEALITELGRVGALRVVSRRATMRYKKDGKPLAEIAAELKVDAIVEGTVLRSGDRVRITTHLVRANPEQHLWAESYERPYADILALQSEVARNVARQVRARVTPEEENGLAAKRPVNPEALEAYLRGKYFFYGYTSDSLRKAAGNFQTAVAKDPDFAPAWAGLARSYGAGGYWGYARPTESLPKAKAAALRAVELDDTLADGHNLLGGIAGFVDWRWDTAERELRRAIALNSSHADARFNYALVLVSLRRPVEALEQLRLVREIDPLHPMSNSLVPGCHALLGQFEKAVEHARQAVQMAPDFFVNRWVLWRCLHWAGDDGAAFAECRRVYELLRDTEVVQALDRGHRRAGYQAAMREAAQTLVRRSGTAYVPATRVALLWSHAGEHDRALEWIEKAYKERDPPLHMVWANPDWQALYSRPRFQNLLRKMGFPSVEKAAAWTR